MRTGFRMIVFLAMASLLFAGISMAATDAAKSDASQNIRKNNEASRVAPADLARPHVNRSLDEILFEQGFESGTMPPANWTRIVNNTHDATYTWHHEDYLPYEGILYASVLYAEDLSAQDEWIISPVFDIAAHGGNVEVSFAWNASYAWAVNPNDNYDMELRISTDGGTTWLPEVLWDEEDNVPFTDWEWYEETISLAAYATATNVKIAFRYHGTDGAQGSIDGVVVETASARGAMHGLVSDAVSSDPLANAFVTIEGTNLRGRTSATGSFFFPNMDPGTYTVKCRKAGYNNFTDPSIVVVAEDTVFVPVDMVSNGLEVAINEEFETVAAGSLPAGWLQVSQDAGTSPFLNNGPTIWQVAEYNGHDSIKCVLNAYNGDESANNDWLILPQQTFGSPISLHYFASSQDANWLETFEIRVSTTGTQPANFTNLIATVTDAPNPWTEYTHDLSAFANQPFYVAFHYISVNEFVIKVDDVVLEGADPNAADEITAVPTEFAFHGNYPNPFNAQTQFRFDLAKSGAVQLVLYNVIGQEAARLVDGAMTAGSHTVAFDAGSLPSGLYLARLTAGEHTAVHKVMLLK